ncbi:MAG TPA: MAPEG family protein, partial [Sphingomicrobium sp.]|nr:MAPEG family protein [Sphingomicrobium sp.]
FAAASLCLAGLVAIASAEVWQAGASGNLLAPVAALAAWSLIMMVWMLVLRLRVTTQLGMTLDSVPRGARGDRLDGWAPDSVQWKAHNYNHLMEQPTLFYAVAISLVLLGDYDQATANFGWAYVGLRVAHSLVQATVNIVKFRLALFVLGTGVQFLLTIRMAALVARASAGG